MDQQQTTGEQQTPLWMNTCVRKLKDTRNSSLTELPERNSADTKQWWKCLVHVLRAYVHACIKWRILWAYNSDGNIIKKQLGPELHSRETGWLDELLGVSTRFVVTSNSVIDFLRVEAITQSAIITSAPYPLIPDSRGKRCSENHRFPLLSTFCQEPHVLSSGSKRDGGGGCSKAWRGAGLGRVQQSIDLNSRPFAEPSLSNSLKEEALPWKNQAGFNVLRHWIGFAASGDAAHRGVWQLCVWGR